MTYRSSSRQFAIHCSSLFDPKLKQYRQNVSITVDPSTGLIVKISDRDAADEAKLEASLPPGDIDLRGKFVLPGFVDAHTHVFLHPYTEADALHQKRDESHTERVVRAVRHCRAALLAGYTTYRDLGTEGMLDADTNLRDAIARGLMPGPRLFVSSREIASTGAFELRTENAAGGHIVPPGPDAVDGVVQCRQAVRRRIAAGADIIKVYADYRRRTLRYPAGDRHPAAQANPESVSFTLEEIKAIVDEARMAQCPVAAHCGTADGAAAALAAGVTSIEHGASLTHAQLGELSRSGIIFVPTLSVYESMRPQQLPALQQNVLNAHRLGVRLACGGDTGPVPHGENAHEMELMMEAGVPAADVIEACTVGGWEACGGDLCGRRFGWFEEGVQADMVALNADPLTVDGALRRVDFVMKDAVVVKRDGKSLLT